MPFQDGLLYADPIRNLIRNWRRTGTAVVIAAVALMGGGLGIVALRPPSPTGHVPAPPPQPTRPHMTTDGAAPGSERFFVLAINGGGSPLHNYESHLSHLKALLSLLPTKAGNPQGVTVLSSDGSDPAPDVATRERETEGSGWQFVGTSLEDQLGPAVTSLKNSEIGGVHLVPATRAALSV